MQRERCKEVLAHPLRMELLNALRHGGPAAASQLAAKPGESSGATSYHLRRLAAQWSSTATSSGTPTRRCVARWTRSCTRSRTPTRELSTWLATRNEWSHAWARSTDMSDMTLRLTPELARDLVGRMHALVDEFRTMAPGKDTPEAEMVRIHTHLFPTRTD